MHNHWKFQWARPFKVDHSSFYNLLKVGGSQYTHRVFSFWTGQIYALNKATEYWQNVFWSALKDSFRGKIYFVKEDLLLAILNFRSSHSCLKPYTISHFLNILRTNRMLTQVVIHFWTTLKWWASKWRLVYVNDLCLEASSTCTSQAN